jgi:hypothetical protein
VGVGTNEVVGLTFVSLLGEGNRGGLGDVAHVNP